MTDLTAASEDAAPMRGGGQGLTACAFALWAGTIALGLAVTFGIGEQADRSILKAFALREGANSAFAIAAVQWISWLGEAAQRSLAMVIFGALLYWRGKRWSALVMVVAPPLSGVGSTLLKEGFGRARPEIVPHLDVITSLSFPSGHATNVMATTLLAALLLARTHRALWFAAALLVAVAIGLSRNLLGVHWPSDVIGGWMWGAGFALMGARIAMQREGFQSEKRKPSLISRPESGA